MNTTRKSPTPVRLTDRRTPARPSVVSLLATVLTAVCVQADRLYVSLYNDGTIVSYDTTAGSPTPTIFASGLNGPNYLAFDAAGNLFATIPDDPSIMKFTPAGVGSVFATAFLAGPDGLAFDSAGNLLVADQVGNFTGKVLKFTPDGAASVVYNDLNTPVAVAFDTAGNLYTLQANGKIWKTPPGGARSSFVQAPYYSFSMAFDSAGDLFVSSYNDNSIRRFTPGGAESTFATGLNQPMGIAFDSAGNLYAANWGNNTIERFTSGGDRSVFATTSGGPAELAITVPEPVSVGVMGVAALLAAVGLGRRRLGA